MCSDKEQCKKANSLQELCGECIDDVFESVEKDMKKHGW